MKHKFPILPFLAVGFLAFACSLTSGAVPAGSQATNAQSTATGGERQSSTAASQPSGSQNTPAANPLKSFPIPPNSTLDSNSADSDEPSADSGSILIHSTASVETLTSFYKTELPKLGWTLRYTDVNAGCGVTQYWKIAAVYLRLDFRYEEGALNIHGQYNRVDAQSMQKYLPDFPLPENAEMVESSSTSWEFYIPQDYQALGSYYQQKVTALNWTTKGPLAPSDGSCGGGPECAGGNSACPAGVEPMIAPTIDFRNELSITYTLPNTNEVTLDFLPHGSATILDVSLTLKSLESAGLPKDVPIYPGAVLQFATPGNATFKIDAAVDVVQKYYEDNLTSAGWSLDGAPFESSGSYISNWQKGDQKIGVMINTDENGCMLIIDCPTCR
jgi:hypothetical protein